MKRIVKFLIYAVAFLGLIAGGTWLLSMNRDMDDVIESRTARCNDLAGNIEKQMIAANYCRRDEECHAVASRCPWGGRKGCRYIITNKNHSTSLLIQDMSQYSLCISRDEKLKEEFAFCYREGSPQIECDDLQRMPLKCVDNKCVEIK